MVGRSGVDCKLEVLTTSCDAECSGFVRTEPRPHGLAPHRKHGRAASQPRLLSWGKVIDRRPYALRSLRGFGNAGVLRTRKLQPLVCAVVRRFVCSRLCLRLSLRSPRGVWQVPSCAAAISPRRLVTHRRPHNVRIWKVGCRASGRGDGQPRAGMVTTVIENQPAAIRRRLRF
jgi:hypothetical protein